MKIVRVLEDLEGGSLGFHWTNREIPMFDAFLPKSKFYIRVENKPLERFTTRQVRLSQVLGSTFLKEAFHSGTSVIVSDCPKGQDTPDGDLHIWPELCDTGLEILLSNETFGSNV